METRDDDRNPGTELDWPDTNKIKLVNTGMIDPFVLFWHNKPIRYLGFKGEFPIIEGQQLMQAFPKRFQQAMRPKVVLAGMSKRLEAVVAPQGVLCGKAAVLLQPNKDICPYAICTLLNSQAFCNLYRGLFAMRGMNGTSLNIGPRQLEQLPIPEQKYLQEYHGPITNNTTRSSVCESRILSFLGKSLHLQVEPSMLQYAEETVRKIMN